LVDVSGYGLRRLSRFVQLITTKARSFSPWRTSTRPGRARKYSGYSDYGQRYYGDDDDDADESEGGESLGESSEELTELIDSDVELRHWLGAGGRWEAVAARVDAAELCYTRPSVDLEPFESEHEGYTGNAGNTVEHWYHRAAVVLWPRERTFVIRAKASPRWGIGEVAKSLRAPNPAAAIAMAPGWRAARSTATDAIYLAPGRTAVWFERKRRVERGRIHTHSECA
jgi:hypothetical protein